MDSFAYQAKVLDVLRRKFTADFSLLLSHPFLQKHCVSRDILRHSRHARMSPKEAAKHVHDKLAAFDMEDIEEAEAEHPDLPNLILGERDF